MKKRFSVLLGICVLFLNFEIVFAQKGKKEKKEATLEFKYLRNSDLSRTLTCNLYISGMFENIPLKGSDIIFYNGTDKITSLKTNNKGRAILVIDPNFNLSKSEDGSFQFSVEYTGNDSLVSLDAKIIVRDVILEMELNPKDTLKTISASVFKKEGDSKKIIQGLEIKFYVSRMFSLLPIGEATTDSTGLVHINFPKNIVGDSIGNVQIVARIVNHDLYATVEKKLIVAWGKQNCVKQTAKHRELWTEIAPMWMILTLSILLLGVWIHYMYVIFKLTKLKTLKTAN